MLRGIPVLIGNKGIDLLLYGKEKIENGEELLRKQAGIMLQAFFMLIFSKDLPACK